MLGGRRGLQFNVKEMKNKTKNKKNIKQISESVPDDNDDARGLLDFHICT